jgi:hypothetical protein
MIGLRGLRARLRTALALGVLAALAALAAAAPAGAAGDRLPSADCLPASTGSELFGSLSRLSSTGTARGGKKDKDTKWASGSTEINGPAPAIAGFTATVPVWYHVVAASTSPRDGWVSDKQIQEQMTALNLGFDGFYGGAQTGFRFVLAGVTRTIDADWFAQSTFQDEVEMKEALKRGDSQTLNLYSTSGGGLLGWAYLPSIVAQQQYQVLDGVVFHFDSAPGGKIKNYNLGFTVVHEVGHWLGLEHTFEQGCSGHGDYVDDTPAEATPTSGCPLDKDTCTAPGMDPVHNFMDYSYDACYEEFTDGQTTRTQEQWLHWRVEHGY